MHELTGDLQALRDRGWQVTNDRHSEIVAVGPYDRIAVDSPSTAIRAGMTVAACLVAEGHDLLRLLNEAYQALPEDAWYLREEILRALMGTSVPPVCAGAGQPTGPARPEADAAALDTTASAGTGRETA